MSVKWQTARQSPTWNWWDGFRRCANARGLAPDCDCARSTCLVFHLLLHRHKNGEPLGNENLPDTNIYYKSVCYVHRMAEREGFEPPVRANGQRFSRPPHSTTLPPLRTGPHVFASCYGSSASTPSIRTSPRHGANHCPVDFVLTQDRPASSNNFRSSRLRHRYSPM